MKKLNYLLILCIGLFQAQNQRFQYEYRQVPDSTQVADIQTEIMDLEVTSKGSTFFSREKFQQDSIQLKDFERQIQTTGAMNVKTTVGGKKLYTDVIHKTYPDYLVLQDTSFGGKYFLVTDNRKMDWKVEPEKQKIGNYETQKATTYFGGRKWTAWFTNDITIQDGPYKFHGLPGLIVKIEDANKTHVFELKGVKKISAATDFNTKPKVTEISYDQYQKSYKDYRKDPTASFRQMMTSGVIKDVRDASGNPMDMNKMLKDREKQVNDQLKKNNNILDLNLLK